MAHATTLLLVTLFVTVGAGQDTEFIRALERAQQARPASFGSTARIAPESEPGTPLRIRGVVLKEDGRTLLANAVVFAYHTDQYGLYDKSGSPAHSWRLKGWARTDAEGRFEFQTIRPAGYPSSTIPSHVHFTVFADEGRYHAGEVRFADDQRLSERERAESKAAGEFGDVRPVQQLPNGGQSVEVKLRLRARDRF